MKTGEIGEEKAARFLRRKGYKILTRNYRTRLGEIDIIAQKGGAVVFVEVKTRGRTDYGTPAEAVGARKRARLAAAAQEYLQWNGTDAPCRFDVVEVYCAPGAFGGKFAFNHIENAFGV
jgi:putative endonuclease